LPIAGAGAGAALGSIADSLASRAARKSGEVVAGKKDKALQQVYTRLVDDYGEQEAQKILNSYASTQGKSLVEAGGVRTAKLAETAAQYPSGGAAAQEFFDVATSNAPERMKQSLGRNVSNADNFYDTADQIVEQGRAKVAPLYNKAYQANQQIDSPIIARS